MSDENYTQIKCILSFTIIKCTRTHSSNLSVVINSIDLEKKEDEPFNITDCLGKCQNCTLSA